MLVETGSRKTAPVCELQNVPGGLGRCVAAVDDQEVSLERQGLRSVRVKSVAPVVSMISAVRLLPSMTT